MSVKTASPTMFAPTPDTLRSAYGTYPTGVVAVCGVAGGVPVGMAASSFVPLSMDPPLVSICVQDTSSTWPVLASMPRVGVSVLAATQRSVCQQLAARHVERFAGVDWRSTNNGAVLVAGAAAWLDCAVERTVPVGDHQLVVLRVVQLRTHPATAPLVFHASAFHTLQGA